MPAGQADRLMPTLRRVVLARQSAARSDGELLGAFVAARDADAFAELVRRHGPMVLGVCRRVAGDRAAADDAFQAVFLVLVRRAASVRPREQVGNWLYGVAYRTALKARTVLARRRSREKQVDTMPEPAAPAPPAWNDLQPVIDEELARLPDKLRIAVVLCDLEGRTQREVARHLNVPPATLATRLATARRTLAQRLTRRGVALSGGALAGLLGTHAAAGAVAPALTTGLVRAVELAATGPALDALVSANAVQLSEGVMQMMMLAKLKALAVTAAIALTLTTGLGVGLVPATAGDDPAPAPGPTTRAALAVRHQPAADPKTPAAPEPEADDSTFLRRLCLDVRGTPPTDVETWFFVSDGDDDKRGKLVEWLTADDAARAALAKKLGIPAERVRVLRVRLAPDGKGVLVVVNDDRAGGDRVARLVSGNGPAVPAEGTVRHAVVIRKLPTNAANGPAIAFALQLDSAATADGPAAGAPVAAGDTTGAARLWRVEGEDKLYQFIRRQVPDVGVGPTYAADGLFVVGTSDSDGEFLKRVLTDVRGSGPTALEQKYFTEDKDPKKREKLLDMLLKDPAVRKKLGEVWKAKMLAADSRNPKTAELNGEQLLFWMLSDGKQDGLRLQVNPTPPKAVEGLHVEGLQWKVVPQPAAPAKPPEGMPLNAWLQGQIAPQPPAPATPAAAKAGKFEKLVGELIAAKKSDEAILEAVTLAALSRLPTDNEKKIVLASIGSVTDRKAAWVAVARAMAGTEEPKKSDGLKIELHLSPPAKP